MATSQPGVPALKLSTVQALVDAPVAETNNLLSCSNRVAFLKETNIVNGFTYTSCTLSRHPGPDAFVPSIQSLIARGAIRNPAMAYAAAPATRPINHILPVFPRMSVLRTSAPQPRADSIRRDADWSKT